MTYFKESNIKMEKNSQTTTTIDTSNLKTIDMTARYGTDENSMPKTEITVLDLNEASQEIRTADMTPKYGIDENSKPKPKVTAVRLNEDPQEIRMADMTPKYGIDENSKPPINIEIRKIENNTNQGQQISEAQITIQNIHDELANKTIESTRPAEGDEVALFTEITTYSDGTTVMTGLNQNYFPGATEYIIIPLDDNGLSKNIIIKEEPDQDKVVLIETINMTTIEEDPIMGQIQQTKQLETTRYFEDRTDGLVKEITSQDSDWIKKMEFVDNPNGISSIEEYEDKEIVYYENGTTKTIGK